MRWTSILLTAIAFVAGCKSSGTTGQDAKEGSDVDLLQHWWVADYYEYKGKPVGDAILRRTRIYFEGDTLNLIETTEEGELVTFKLNEDETPKHIDMKIAKGPDSGKLALGIYRLDGDSLRICWAAPGQPRPTAFTTMNEMGVACLSLHRLRDAD